MNSSPNDALFVMLVRCSVLLWQMRSLLQMHLTVSVKHHQETYKPPVALPTAWMNRPGWKTFWRTANRNFPMPRSARCGIACCSLRFGIESGTDQGLPHAGSEGCSMDPAADSAVCWRGRTTNWCFRMGRRIPFPKAARCARPSSTLRCAPRGA